MTAPTVATWGNTTGGTTDATTKSITLPTHQAGDLLVVHVAVDGNPTVTFSSGSSGWTHLGQATNGTAVTGSIWYLLADGSGKTLTLAFSNTQQCSWNVAVVRPRGQGSTGYTFSIEGTSSNGSSTNSDPALHTHSNPVAADTLIIATRAGDSTVVATVKPSGFSGTLQSIAAGGTSGASANAVENNYQNVNSVNPGTFTSATEQWVCWTLMIRTIPESGSGITIDGLGDNGPSDDVSWQILLPDHYPGDLMALWVAVDGGPSVEIVAGSGWEWVAEAAVGSAVSGTLFVKEVKTESEQTVEVGFFGASETASARTFVIRPGTGKRISKRNIDWALGTTTAANGTSPALTLSKTRDAFWLVALATDANLVASSEPAGYANLLTVLGGSTEASISTAWKLANQSSDTPGAWTVSAEDHVMLTFAAWHTRGNAPIDPRSRFNHLLMR